MNDDLPLPGVDPDSVRQWMDELGLGNGPLTSWEQLTGGTQNVLLRFRRGSRDYVLRRPPLNKRPESDQTIAREARVLNALADTSVPHPRLIASCDDTSVIGAAFFLMEPVDGFNPTIRLPSFHSARPEVRRQIGLNMVDSVAGLGAVDHVNVGLEDFGRVDGFLERQAPRWRKQLHGYSTFDGYDVSGLVGVDDIGTWLEGNTPSTFVPGVMHGDFHLANVMVSHTSADVVSIVDWELSTVGDPLIDLGWLLATWVDPDEHDRVPPVVPWDGFPRAGELVERYASQSPRSTDSILWYEVLACYKLGIILEGSHARAIAGLIPQDVGERLHAVANRLFRRALRRMG